MNDLFGGSRKKKILSLFILIIIFGGSFQSMISTAAQRKESLDYFTIDVEFFGVETHEKRELRLSNENMIKLLLLIKNIEETVTHAQSLEELRCAYQRFLPELSEVLSLDTRREHQIYKSFQTIDILNRFLEKKGSPVKDNQQDTTNSFCYVSGDTTNTAVFRIHNILPKPFFDWLNEKLYYWTRAPWVLFLTLITLYPLYCVSTFLLPYTLSFLPVNLMTVLTLGATWTPSMGWVYTNGVYGMKQWESPLYGRIGSDQRLYLNLPAAFYPAILGFSGIKINLGEFNGPWYFMSHQFYFGTAIFVSIDNED